MKKYIKSLFLAAAVVFGMTSCESFLDTDIDGAVDIEDGLTSVDRIEVALNGTYNALYSSSFGGNYVVAIGDIAGDLVKSNFSTGHFTSIATYNIQDTDSYLSSIWAEGYSIIDNASRIIKAGEALLESTPESEKPVLMTYLAEAHSLRALAYLYMSNIFALPYKVDNGTDNGETLGLVVVKEPVQPGQKVKRSTVAKTYEAIFEDLKRAIKDFETAGSDRGFEFMNLAATQALYARASLYVQDYDNAAKFAKLAIDNSGTSVTTDGVKYKTMYTELAVAGKETILNIHVDSQNNLTANSPGTLWTDYGMMPNIEYGNLLGEKDIRKFLTDRDPNSQKEASLGGKYLGLNGNPAVSSQRLIGAPEMYLIIAEANLKAATPNLEAAKEALLKVAARNNAIEDTEDLPSAKAELVKFVEDERARELMQEGHRFQDCRRWGKLINVYFLGDDLGYKHKNFDVSKFVYPIPNNEMSAAAGVEQNEGWEKNLPK